MVTLDSGTALTCPCVHDWSTATRPGYVIWQGRRTCVDFAAREESQSAVIDGLLSGATLAAYITGDPTHRSRVVRHVTTYLGNRLGRIYRPTYAPTRYARNGDSSRQLTFVMRDVNGEWWRGWGSSERDAVSLRRMKHAPRDIAL